MCPRKHPILAISLSLLLTGCETLALTIFGVGATAGVAHTMNGIVYKTFSAPMPRVKKATVAALGRMAIKVEGTERTERGEVIKAKTTERDIEVELEMITPKATRIRAQARKPSMFMDAATASEIIVQTEKALSGA